MNNDTVLNIVNAPDLTNWVKAITWGDTVAVIRFADIKRREFVSENSDAMARMMVHSYIKKYIPFYMNDLIGTDVLTPPAPNAELSGPVRAAAAAGFTPYIFNASNIPAAFTTKIKKLNDYLHGAAMKYIERQTVDNSTDFSFDIQYLTQEFADYRKTITRARWNAKMPPMPQVSSKPKDMER